MNTSPSRLAIALHDEAPALSMDKCELLAAKVARMARRAANEEWNITRLQLVPRNNLITPLGMTLRQLRIDNDLSQADVARETNWSPSKVSRMETGKVNITYTDLKALLPIYRVTDKAMADQLESMRTS